MKLAPNVFLILTKLVLIVCSAFVRVCAALVLKIKLCLHGVMLL